ncbi:MAG: GNAT family N-acetyltransferase [Herbiconiux sp.]|nr:GNAT family N-acetyltransferase [Herbiconiux sp.]
MVPAPTARLRFREMTADDLDRMADLLGDPAGMTYYPAPKSRAEAARWIAWNRANYAAHEYGLWVVEQHDGTFVGDCGLTWQAVGDTRMLELGYHVRAALQGRGFATEAALACRDLARAKRLAPELVAIVHPENEASRRVAEKAGLTAWLGENDSEAEAEAAVGGGAGAGRAVLRLRF